MDINVNDCRVHVQGDDGKPISHGTVDPSDIFGPDGWCEAENPRIRYGYQTQTTYPFSCVTHV
jgi:hypothetical protein